MDDTRFDTLTRILATTPTRRRSLGLLAGVGLGGLATLLGSPQGEVGEAEKRNRKQNRNRKQHRRKDKRKRKPEQPRTGDCDTGTKACNGTCIDTSRCCTDDDCAAGQVCDVNQACVTPACPADTKRCGTECIASEACCTNAECTSGQTCEPGSCTCPTGTKPCNGSCIASDQCCSTADCTGGTTCQQGRCTCPTGTKLCGTACIPTTNCCSTADCTGGKTCQEGSCVRTGRALYPELRTLPASDLTFDRLDDGTYVLRFGNTVWNAGEGRLEIEGNPNPNPNGVKKIYQNLYDAPVGGNLVSHKQVNSDIIYHPTHMHFHFANFASYLLLQRNAAGVYQETTKKGTKTSFCIMDTERFEGSYPDQYRECGTALQGLTPGWGDTYGYTLPDQWVVLGTQPLADGEYGIQSTADPKGVLNEGGGARETNNTNVTYFTVSGGQITHVRNAP
jgi:hypothetical protein